MDITVYCGSSTGDEPAYAQAAQALGNWIAQAGHRLIYGGSAVGLMGIVSKAALEGGAHVTGVEPRFLLDREIPQHDLPELLIVRTMAERRTIMIERGDIYIALPGGVGTLEEITEIMSRIRLDLTQAPCILLNIGGFYDSLATLLDAMVEHGFLAPSERASIVFCDSVEDAIVEIESLSQKQEEA